MFQPSQYKFFFVFHFLFRIRSHFLHSLYAYLATSLMFSFPRLLLKYLGNFTSFFQLKFSHNSYAQFILFARLISFARKISSKMLILYYFGLIINMYSMYLPNINNTHTQIVLLSISDSSLHFSFNLKIGLCKYQNYIGFAISFAN